MPASAFRICVNCDNPIRPQTIQQMVDQIMQLGSGTRLQILSPVVRDRKGEYRKEIAQFSSQGFVRVRIDGEMHELEETPTLDRKKRHTIELVVDRIVLKDDIERRLADSLETALRESGGFAVADVGPGEREIPFSELAACTECGASYPEINPANVLVQQPARCLRGVCADSGPATTSIRTRHPRSRAVAFGGRDRSVQEVAAEPRATTWRC